MAEPHESLEKTLQRQKAEKYDSKLEDEIRTWISEILERPSDRSASFYDEMKDGIILCELTLKENISNYLTTCLKLGLQETDVFDTIDLYEAKDMNKVLANLHFVYRHFNELKTKAASLPPEEDLPIQNGSLRRRGTIGRMQSQDIFKSPMKIEKVHTCTGCGGKQKEWAKFCVNCGAPQPPSASASMSSLQIPGSAEKPTRRTVKARGTMEFEIPSVSSLENDIAAKEELKYNPELERMAREWIENVTEDKFSSNSFAESLKSGVLLCKLINKIKPNTISKINASNIAYQQMENIDFYLKACESLGMRGSDLFNTSDLFNEKNVNLVIGNIHVLAKLVKKMTDYTGPHMETEDISKTRNLFSESLVEGNASPIDSEPATDPKHIELVEWANSHLSKIDAKRINNLTGDIRSGVPLIQLIEIVTQTESIGGYIHDPSNLWHCMQNASLVLRFLSSQTFENVQSFTARDIVTMRVEAVVSLLEYIRDKFDMDYLYMTLVNSPLEEEEDISALERTYQDVFESDIDVENSSTSSLPSFEQLQMSASSIKLPMFEEEIEVKMPEPVEEPQDEPVEEPQDKPVEEPAKPEPEVLKLDMSQVNTAAVESPQRKNSLLSKLTGFIKSPRKEENAEEKLKSPRKETEEKSPRKLSNLFRLESPRKQEIEQKEIPHIESPTQIPPVITETSSTESSPSVSTSASTESTPDIPKKKEKKEKKAKKEKKDKKPKKEKKEKKTKEKKEKKVKKVKQTIVVQEEIQVKTIPPAGHEEPKIELNPPQPKHDLEDLKKFECTPLETLEILYSLQQSAPDRLVKAMKPLSNLSLILEEIKKKKKFTPEELHVLKAQSVMRKRIAMELLTTEKNYCTNLAITAKLVSDCKAKKVLSEEELKGVFGNVTELSEHHKAFLALMQQRLDTWKENSLMGDLFLASLDFIEKYRFYLQNYNASFATVHYITKKNPLFAQTIEQFENEQLAASGLNLESFLIMPVQRLPRYILLLKDMLKYTHPKITDYKFINKAIESLNTKLLDINKSIVQGEIEMARQILEIEKTIDGDFETLVKPKRRYVREGVLKLKLQKAGRLLKGMFKKEAPPYWFLFSDLLVWVKPKKSPAGEKVFDYVCSVKVSDITSVKEIQEGKNKETALALSFRNNDGWTLKAGTLRERSLWVEDIANLLKGV